MLAIAWACINIFHVRCPCVCHKSNQKYYDIPALSITHKPHLCHMPQTGQGHMAWAVRVDNNKVDKVSLDQVFINYPYLVWDLDLASYTPQMNFDTSSPIVSGTILFQLLDE